MVCKCGGVISDNELAYIEEIAKKYDNDKNSLIQILHEAQTRYGALTPEVQKKVSEVLDIPLAKVYGVVTFYHFFTMKKKGKYQIKICTGTACFVKGANFLVDEFAKELGIKVGETTEDGLFSLDTVRCVGACSLAPVVVVNEDIYKRVGKKDVKDIIAKYKEAENEL